MSHCPFCQKKIAMSKAFCSRDCKENYFQTIAIKIPKLFLKRIYIFCNEVEREREIENFAARHQLKLSLCHMKVREEAIKDGYIDESEDKNNMSVLVSSTNGGNDSLDLLDEDNLK